MNPKPISESRAVKTAIVLPPDTNNLGTMFGGKVMAYIDDTAGLSAMRHSRMTVVTASTDSVDFLHPIRSDHAICLESFVTWTHKTSMEVFVKIMGEDLRTGKRTVCATAFLTSVALDEKGKPHPVPGVIPETELEKRLYDTAPARARIRNKRRKESQALAKDFGT
ncbi:MAG: acyl-CoA thioesterase [Deltaproteobacteria bacterium]|nr:acyl-CoA thioesterase [Deltaproteobacteria bacterium]